VVDRQDETASGRSGASRRSEHLGEARKRHPQPASRLQPRRSHHSARLLRLSSGRTRYVHQTRRIPHDRVAHVEQALSAHFNDFRFLPHLVLHELEAWVFAAHEELAELYGDKNLSGKLRQDVKLAGGPEMVNDDPATAPSKRLVRYRPDYIKVSDGPLAIGELGLSPLRKDCPHLDSWLASLGVV
jgi:hypothetical protein